MSGSTEQTQEVLDRSPLSEQTSLVETQSSSPAKRSRNRVVRFSPNMPSYRRRRGSDLNASPQQNPTIVANHRQRRSSGLPIPGNHSQERPPIFNGSHGHNTVNSPRESYSSRTLFYARRRGRRVGAYLQRATSSRRDECRISSRVSSGLVPPSTVQQSLDVSDSATDAGSVSLYSPDDIEDELETIEGNPTYFGPAEEEPSKATDSRPLEAGPAFREAVVPSRVVPNDEDLEQRVTGGSEHESTRAGPEEDSIEPLAQSYYSDASTFNHPYPPSQVATTNRSVSTFCSSGFGSPIESPGVLHSRIGQAGVLSALTLGPAAAGEITVEEIINWIDNYQTYDQSGSLEQTFMGLTGPARLASPAVFHRSEEGPYRPCLRCGGQGPFPMDTFHNQDGTREPFPARMLERELDTELPDHEGPSLRGLNPQTPFTGLFRCPICRLSGPSLAVLYQEVGRISTESASGSEYHFESAYSENYFSLDDEGASHEI